MRPSIAVVACLLLPCVLPAQTRTFTVIDVPGAVNTYATALAPDGSIFGSYDLDAAHGNAFMRDRDGTITSFSVPGAPVTYALGRTPDGSILGFYGDPFGFRHGYLRDAAGAFSFFDVPGAAFTVPYSSDAAGRIVGAAFDPSGFVQGFVRDAAGGFTTFAVPGAFQTFAFSLTAAGDVYGTSLSATGYRGFHRDPLGAITPFDILPGVTATFPFRIALDGGRMSGSYEDATGATHGFLRGPTGIVETIDVAPLAETSILDFDAAGDVVGYYGDLTTGTFHAFVGIVTPEPTTLTLAALGLLALGLATVRRRA